MPCPTILKARFVTSGIRIGTPAITTRGFGIAEMELIAGWIADVVDSFGDDGADPAVLDRVRQEVLETCAKFPVYAR